MKTRELVGGLILAVQILGSAGALAGPWEDGPGVRLYLGLGHPST